MVEEMTVFEILTDETFTKLIDSRRSLVEDKAEAELTEFDSYYKDYLRERENKLYRILAVDAGYQNFKLDPRSKEFALKDLAYIRDTYNQIKRREHER
jgi:hypothetical protein